MCSLFDQRIPRDQVEKILDYHDKLDGRLPFSGHIRPSHPITIVRAEDGRTAEAARWGLIRSWNKKKPDTKTTFQFPTPSNSRDDKIFTERMYSGLMAQKRCVIPAAAWAEYIGEKGAKQEVWLEDRDGAPLLIAGLYDDWKDPETGDWIRSATMVTVPSNDFTRPWHEERRIKPLYEDAVDIWLDSERYDEDELREILRETDEGRFRLREQAI